jgi:hypothetical protein
MYSNDCLTLRGTQLSGFEAERIEFEVYARVKEATQAAQADTFLPSALLALSAVLPTLSWSPSFHHPQALGMSLPLSQQ